MKSASLLDPAVALLAASLILLPSADASHPSLGAGQQSLNLEKRNSIDYPSELPIPGGLEWLPDHSLAATPDGKYAWALIPNLSQPALARREDPSGPRATVKQFKLAQIDLETGGLGPAYDLRYDAAQAEHPSFALSPDGQYLCTISQGKVRVLGRTMTEMESFDSGLKQPGGAVLSATQCGFLGESNKLFVVYLGLQPAPPEFHSAIMVYDWQHRKIVHILPIEGLAEDAIPAGDALLSLYTQFAKKGDEQLLAKLRIDGGRIRVVWQKGLLRGRGPLQLSASTDYVFFVFDPISYSRKHGLLWIAPTAADRKVDVFPPSQPCWATRPPGVPRDAPCVPSPRLAGETDSQDGLDPKVRAWSIDSGGLGPDFGVSGYRLHTPLATSNDRRWLVVGATHFTNIEELGFTGWDDTRFAIFDLSGRFKKPLYLSENFGPAEAIVDLTFVPDGSSLIVATSARIIIYDIREAPTPKP